MSSPVTFSADQIGPAFPVVDDMAGVALLVTWSQLCPTEDRCDYSLIDSALDYWGARGKQVVIGVATVGFPYRIANAAARVADATPGWVLDEVATYRSSSLVLGQRTRVQARFPFYSDPKFLAEVSALVAQLGRYDGHPGIAQIRISTGLLTEDNPSPAGLDYMIPGFGDQEWLIYCRGMADLFRHTFIKTQLEFDIGRLAIAHDDGSHLTKVAIDAFMQSLIASHVMIAFNGLRSTTITALRRTDELALGPSDGVSYALRILQQARRKGDGTGLEFFAPSTDPTMQDRAAILSVVRELNPSRIVVFSTEAAMVQYQRGAHSKSEGDAMAWIRSQPAWIATSANSESFLRELAGD